MDNELEVLGEGITKRGISRRNLIKGGVIVGGTLWVAPVVESFTSKAYGATASQLNYCCSCWPLVGTVYQGESDNHPPTASDCASYCAGLGYTSYTWCGPSTVGLTYSPSTPPGPGCYTVSSQGALVPVTGCTTGATGYDATTKSTGSSTETSTNVFGNYIGV